jgi:3-hydroxyanthranilate 3,4-dioxygenase
VRSAHLCSLPPKMSSAPSLCPPQQPINLPSWVSSIRHELSPPVGNKLLHSSGQHKVMVVGGPNARSDFHVEAGEELFLQLEGSMVLRVMEHGKSKDIAIAEGEIFLLPPWIPHSPQRTAGTVGLVLERERLQGETDALRWYAADGRVLYEEAFPCTDLGSQIKAAIARFQATEAAASGDPCAAGGASAPGALPVLPTDLLSTLPQPIRLAEWLGQQRAENQASALLYAPGAPGQHSAAEYRAEVFFGGEGAAAEPAPSSWQQHSGEVFLLLLQGSSATVRARAQAGAAEAAAQAQQAQQEHVLQLMDSLLLPCGSELQLQLPSGCACLLITNKQLA